MNRKKTVTIISGAMVAAGIFIYIFFGLKSDENVRINLAVTLVELVGCVILFASLIDEENIKRKFGAIFTMYVFFLEAGFLLTMVRYGIVDNIVVLSIKGMLDSILMYFFWRYILCINNQKRKYIFFNVLMCIMLSAGFVNAAIYALTKEKMPIIANEGNLVCLIIKAVYFVACSLMIIIKGNTNKRKIVLMAYFVLPLIIDGIHIIVLKTPRGYESLFVAVLLIYAFVQSERKTETKETDNDMETASKIQEFMLEKKFEEVTSVDVYAYVKAADAVGGDYYDFFMIDKNHLLLTIGDVSCQGTQAALYMIKALNAVRKYANKSKKCAEIMAAVNRELCENNEEGCYVTSWLGILNTDTGKLDYVNAGHTSPILISKYGAEFTEDEPDMKLGINPDSEYKLRKTKVEECGGIVLYTDGITDCGDNKGKLFGTDKLLLVSQTLIDKNSQKITEGIIKSISDFTLKEKQEDDIAVLTVRRNKL